MNDSAKVEPLTRTTVYTHGVIGNPLAVIGYPLAIWIPAHYAGELGPGQLNHHRLKFHNTSESGLRKPGLL